MSLRHAKITAVSHYVPERRVSNKDLEKIIDTSDQWIFERTGIRERRVAEKGQATSDLATIAAKRLCEKREIRNLNRCYSTFDHKRRDARNRSGEPKQ